MPLLTVSGVQKLYGAHQVLAGASFQVAQGEHVALVGANGTGKSTLFRIIAGVEDSDAGQVSLARNAIVTYVAQHPRFKTSHTLWDAMLEVFGPALDAQARMRQLEQEMAAGSPSDGVPAEYKELGVLAEHAGYDYESRIERVLTGLELPRRQWHQPASRLSGGQRTRGNLARALLRESDLLLLDEPTNHLDIGAIEWLESYLKSLPQAFLVVAHDRYFLQGVSRRTLDLASGAIEDYPAPYLEFLRLREQRHTRAGLEYERQQEQIAATEEFVRRFGAGQRSKEAKGRQKRLDRLDRLDRPHEEQQLKLHLDKTRAKGTAVVRLEGLVAGYARRAVVQAPDELFVRPGARVAIVGPNGAGKTTLARTLIGELAPVRGNLAWSRGSTPAYYAQATSTVFDAGHSVLEAFESRFNVGDEGARSYLGQFLFTGDDVYRRVGDLSGGERSRLALAALLYSHPNVVVLDEPTNHLDINAREALERALRGFGGTIILISHDRFLIDRLATEVWSIEDGRLQIFDGNWSDFAAGRGRRGLTFSNPPVQGTEIQHGDAETPRYAGSLGDHPHHASSPNGSPTISRQKAAEIVTEMEKVHDAAAPVLSRLTILAATAPVGQLQELTDDYEALQRRLEELTGDLIGARC